jgi:hypothetical protein
VVDSLTKVEQQMRVLAAAVWLFASRRSATLALCWIGVAALGRARCWRQEVWPLAQLPDVVAVEQSLDRGRKKRVPDLVTRVRRELQGPLRIADQLVGQRLRYGHAARNLGVECREDDGEMAGRSLGSRCCHGGVSTERAPPFLTRLWLSEIPVDPARGYAAVGSKYFPGRDAPWEV